MSTSLTMTADTFDQLLAAPSPILVDFWAEGCGPCNALAPVLDEIAREHTGRLRVGTVRLDDAPGLAHRFQIMALPTLIVFSGGKEKKRITGPTDKGRLHRELGEFLV